MKKKDLLVLIRRIKEYDLKIDIPVLLSIDNNIVNVLRQIDDETIFRNAYNIVLSELDNKFFIIELMSKVKDPLISNIVYKQAFNTKLKDYNTYMKLISESKNIDFATSFSILLNNNNLMKLENHKEIIELLRNDDRPNMIKFISGIISNTDYSKDMCYLMFIINNARKCNNEHIAFILYRIIQNKDLRDSKYYIYCVDKITGCKNKKMAEIMYQVMTDKNMIDNADYICKINDLYDALINDKYYKITNINDIISEYINSDNYNEFENNLKNIDEETEIKNKMLVLMINK